MVAGNKENSGDRGMSKQEKMDDITRILEEIESGFRDNVAPTWYLSGTRFSNESLNRHCRSILKIRRE